MAESKEDDDLLERLRAALPLKAFESEGDLAGTGKDFELETYRVEKRLILRFHMTNHFQS